MEIAMQPITGNGNSGASYSSNDRVTAANGAGAAYRASAEAESLIVQIAGSNGETGHTEGQKNNFAHRIKREMNETVFGKVKLWMIFIFLPLLFIAVIIISLVVCSAIHEDVDENFDSSLFAVPLHFNGSFQLPNLAFTQELFNHSSNESQALTADLQGKIVDLYSTSPALGRYFSNAEIYALRNDSVIVDYQLIFLMPKEEQDQLRNFTLSREMVYNVFRQFLYDQEPDSSGSMYIEPISLTMFLRHR